MDILVRVVYQGVTYDLDIENNIPLRLDVSAVENGEIGAFFGVGSQAFELPGTKTNNRFFKHSYEIGAEDIPAFYNSITGYIIYDGETILEGQFQLLEIVTDADGFTTYKCQLTDSVVQFKDSLSSLLVKDADWSSYNHTLSNEIITASWDNDLLSGSVYYPIADYGRDETDLYPIVPRLQLGTDIGAIGSVQSPLQLKQFLPAIKLKDTLDVLFDQVGFRYTGSFTETDDFNNMYILNKPKEGLGVVTSQDTTADFSAGASANQVLPVGENYIVSASNEFFDDSNAYDTTTNTYTIPDTGQYTFQGQVQFLNPIQNTWPDQAFVQLYLVIDTDGNPNNAIPLNEDVVRVDQSTGIGPYYLNVEYTDTFAAGVKLRLQGYITQQGGTNTLNTTLLLNGTQFKAINTPVTYEGALVDMGLQWNPKLKSIDFIKGLVNQFNLVMTPKYGVNKTIEIEQFDDWVRMGQFKDWTQKYENAIRIGINHTVNEQQRELLLKNVDDNDRFSKLSQENQPNFQYGTLRLLSDNNVSQGNKTIGDFFAPVVLGGSLVPFETGSDGTPTFNIDFGTNFVLPHLYKYDNSKQTSFAFKPRIGYKVTNTIPSGSNVNVGNTTDYITVSGSYSTISNLSTLPAVSGSTNDLHFTNDYANFSYSNLGWDNGTTSFEKYWKTYLDSLYWEGSRKLTIDLQFSAYEYKSINLNDIIFIKDQRYRINKISGFNITSDDVVTVELIRLYPSYYNNETIIDLDCGFDFNGLVVTPTPTPTATPTPTPTATPVAFSALGGTTGSFTSGGVDYTYHEFANTDRDTTETFSLTTLSGTTTAAKVVVVAGGAGGGANFSGNGALGGGGGGGQVIASSSITLSYPNNYSIQVGKGGDARLFAAGSGPGGRGDDSYFSGSGVNIYSNAGYPGQGVSDYDGGNSWLYLYGDGNASGNGGGGASAAQNGQNADSTNGGDGGDGLSVNLGYPVSPTLGNDFSANNYLLGAGGGGSSISSLDRGIGGDQEGGDGRDSRLATDGGRYYGAGGGGREVVSDTRGSFGGDGIVIVIYPTN